MDIGLRIAKYYLLGIIVSVILIVFIHLHVNKLNRSRKISKHFRN